MCSENIYIAGRYNKYMRNLSQSPWIDKNDIRIKDSVQEMIEDGMFKYLKFDNLVFSSSGREDVDVRMLGNGRPFVYKFNEPCNVSSFNNETMKQIQDYVNDKYSGLIKINDLQVVSKGSVTKNMRDGEEGKHKEYRALCCCSRVLTQEDIDKISNVTDLYINQTTPIRVLHRRTWAVRRRKIFRLKIDKVSMGDFESVNNENLSHVFALTLLTEAGTYIKEFVHSDFGRTEPSLSDLLGDCETDLMELDVTEVYLDWPPKISYINSTTTTSNQEDKSVPEEASCTIATSTMNDSEKNLSDLYSEALKLMQKAESMARSDERQDLYIKSRRNFELAMNLVENLELFSENETIDDVATNDLKYILIPAYLAKIAISSDCSLNRLETFKRAEELIRRFLLRISGYNMLDKSMEKAIKSNSDELAQSGTTSAISLESAMQSRTEKIANYKRMKLLEDKISQLEDRLNSQTQNEVDDEVAREYYTSLINKWIRNSYESLEQEIKPAIIFETNRSDSQPLPSSSSDDSASQSNQVKNLKPFTIVKDDLQKKVFGLGYPSRPTLTVDEFINQKFQAGELSFQAHKEVYGNSLQRYAEKPDLLKEQEELSDAEHDEKEDRNDAEELKKKRSWDEFKDENPRGSGNRHNMG